MKHAFWGLSAAVLLAACGGGGTGETSIQNLWLSSTSPAALVRAKDSATNGVAIIENRDDPGEYKYDYEIVSTIAEETYSDGSTVGEYVIRYADGTTANVAGIFRPESAIYLVAGEDIKWAASGSQAVNLPIGSYTYFGDAYTLYSYNGEMYSELGNFDMTLYFSNRTGSMRADTAESRYFNSGLTINNSGEIFGRNGTFYIFATDGLTVLETRTVDFHGTLHGNGATEVSGVGVNGSTSDSTLSVVAVNGSR